LSLQPSHLNNNEIDFKELFLIIWKGKLTILLMIITCVFYGIYYIQNSGQKYSVSIIYKQVIPSGEIKGFGKLGGLASIAGLSLPASSSSSLDFDSFIHLMTSEEVAEKIFKNEELTKKLFLAEFDEASNTFRMPEVGFLGSLKRKIKPIITGRENEPYRPPDPQRLSLKLKQDFSISVDLKTGFLVLTAETGNPKIVIELMKNAVMHADILVKNRFIKNSTQSIDFYMKKIARAKSREHREALARLIGEEEKRLMLTSRGENFVVEPISRPQISFYPTSPGASLILAVSIIAGVSFGILLVFLRNSLKRKVRN
jgi:uncharacterized protein involved in exopolysaccharide biosynthesis